MKNRQLLSLSVRNQSITDFFKPTSSSDCDALGSPQKRKLSDESSRLLFTTEGQKVKYGVRLSPAKKAKRSQLPVPSVGGTIIDAFMKGVKKGETCSNFKNSSSVNCDGCSSCGKIQKLFSDSRHPYVLEGNILMRSPETDGTFCGKDDNGMFFETEKEERTVPTFCRRSCLNENCGKSVTSLELEINDVDDDVDKVSCPRTVHIPPRKPQEQNNGVEFPSSLEICPKEKLLRKSTLKQSENSSALSKGSHSPLRDEMCSLNVCRSGDSLNYRKRKQECTDEESSKKKREVLPSCLGECNLEKLHNEEKNRSKYFTETVELKGNSVVLEQKSASAHRRKLFSMRNQDKPSIPSSSSLDQCSMHSPPATADSLCRTYAGEKTLNCIDSDENNSFDSDSSSVRGGNYLKSDSGKVCDLESDDENETPLPVKQIFSLNLKPPLDTPGKSCSPTLSQQSTPAFKMNFPVIKQNSYSNDLERMVKEKKESESLDELDKKLQDGIKRRLSGFCLNEESEQSTDEDASIAEEYREFVRRYSIVVDVIPDIHPGEEIFHAEEFGKLLSPEILDLKNCCISTQNPLEKLIASSGINWQINTVTLGVLSKACHLWHCSIPVCKWLFQMMSLHPDFFTSVRILNALMDIFLNSIQKRGKGETCELWTPSLKDICTVFLSMGASFQSLFPLQRFQPDFTYEQIMSEINALKSSCSSSRTCISEGLTFLSPFNIMHVIKFLVFCMNLCTEAYTDHELVLLVSTVCRISLERKLQLVPLIDFESLLESLLKNIKDWDSKLPVLCLILTDISDHHHNLLRVVQLLPSTYTRGRQLRRHLSLVIISKLLDRKCTYIPSTPDFRVCHLNPYLVRMKPTDILKKMEAGKSDQTVDSLQSDSQIKLDQQVYYLTYNLLLLAGEAVQFEVFPSSQRESLVQLCCDLEKHVKGDIREDPRLLYRSKVKDLAVRIHAKWQDVTQRCRSLQGKLHDYWEPVSESGDHSRDSSSLNESEQKPFTEVVALQKDFRSINSYMDLEATEETMMQSNQID